MCVGCVIRGETPHFDYVAGEAARGISEVGRSTGVPTTFGLITANTREQAEARAGGAVGNRGEEAALAALELLGSSRISTAARSGGRGQPRGGARAKTVGRRRQARECALQLLYELDVRGTPTSARDRRVLATAAGPTTRCGCLPTRWSEASRPTSPRSTS